MSADLNRIEYGMWAESYDAFIATMSALINPLTKTPLISVTSAGITPSRFVRLDPLPILVKQEGVYDLVTLKEQEAPIIIPGFHANLIAVGPLYTLLTAGMPTTGSVFDRTSIRDPRLIGETVWEKSAVGEPEGYVGSSGIKVFDLATISNRVRVWI